MLVGAVRAAEAVNTVNNKSVHAFSKSALPSRIFSSIVLARTAFISFWLAGIRATATQLHDSSH